jgi:hypothetical protein
MRVLFAILGLFVFLSLSNAEVLITEAQVLKIYEMDFVGTQTNIPGYQRLDSIQRYKRNRLYPIGVPGYEYKSNGIHELMLKVISFESDETDDDLVLIEKLKADEGIIDVYLAEFAYEDYRKYLARHRRVFSQKARGGLMVSGILSQEHFLNSEQAVPLLKNPVYQSAFGSFNPNRAVSSKSIHRADRFAATQTPYMEKAVQLITKELVDETSALVNVKCNTPKGTNLQCEAILRTAKKGESRDEIRNARKFKYFVKFVLNRETPEKITETKAVPFNATLLDDGFKKQMMQEFVMNELSDPAAELEDFSCFDKGNTRTVCHAILRDKVYGETKEMIAEAMRFKLQIEVKTLDGLPKELMAVNEVPLVDPNEYDKALDKLINSEESSVNSIKAVNCFDLNWNKMKCEIICEWLDKKQPDYKKELLIEKKNGYPVRIIKD